MMMGGSTRLAGVMGWPVAHSRSPKLHGFWLERYRIDGAYLPLAVRPEGLEAALRGLSAMGFSGCNLTIPHKEAALNLVGEVSPRAARIGAVNTVIVTEGGTLRGDNSDGFGFIENLREQAPRFDAASGAAMVLGAGGAARAVCVALMAAGAPEIRLLNRTMPRAEMLGKTLGPVVTALPWAGRHAALEDARLVVNTTSLGMAGQPALDLDLALLPAPAVVNDLVYSPLDTALLVAARRRGNIAVDGLGMLLHQARPGFAAWFGVEPEVTAELRAFVAAE
ncbi:MAG: shikimate dehydrogenase [Alphaproteobacteria bacterium]|jgi:shikimate dehydrogenase|nr:shikimate dehydrogenase [Alphaproteobacteria bacterium]MDP6590904.1 shikimate dehydrogenase [Alphaproteobacteria bacterium]MDP6818116.1 shikimate dehydrogenase [Alphaproteobacteria bacterium]